MGDRYYAYTCGTGKEADFWLITDDVNLETTFAEIIYVDVEAELTMCFHPGYNAALPCYSNNFEVYLYHGKNESRPSHFPDIADLLRTFSPLYNISNHTGNKAELLSKSIQTFSFHKNNSRYVTFAIRSRGACGTIFRMKMYYYGCEKTFFNGVHFPRTSSPSTGYKAVIGNCSKNSLPLQNTTNFIGFCYSNGTWAIRQETKCLCSEGYYLSKTTGCLGKYNHVF